MHIVLAHDGSPSADRATELVASLGAPGGSSVTVITVSRRDGEAAHLEADAGAVVARLRSAGWTAASLAATGRPSDAIVDAARDLEATLIVVGDRGHSAIARLMLGSTAAAVADHAPCAVLIARTPAVERIALADDGSETARVAGEFLADSGLFGDTPVTVVTVAQVDEPLLPRLDGDADLRDAAESVLVAERAGIWLQGEETAQRVGAATRSVRLRGQPAAELVRYADETDMSLMVLGTRGDTGFTRVLLGSVARNVLLHATSSVLVVRPPLAAVPTA
jgi:nucleotide-binding universal stress UspA family protein